MGDTEQYHDTDGNPVTLEKLCRDEPMWAVSRIRHMRQQLAELEQQLTWISVEERTPNEDEPVFVMHRDLDIHCAAKRLERENYGCLEGGEILDWNPTHWLPIPKGR